MVELALIYYAAFAEFGLAVVVLSAEFLVCFAARSASLRTRIGLGQYPPCPGLFLKTKCRVAVAVGKARFTVAVEDCACVRRYRFAPLFPYPSFWFLLAADSGF